MEIGRETRGLSRGRAVAHVTTTANPTPHLCIAVKHHGRAVGDARAALDLKARFDQRLLLGDVEVEVHCVDDIWRCRVVQAELLDGRSRRCLNCGCGGHGEVGRASA